MLSAWKQSIAKSRFDKEDGAFIDDAFTSHVLSLGVDLDIGPKLDEICDLPDCLWERAWLWYTSDLKYGIVLSDCGNGWWVFSDEQLVVETLKKAG
jgi:hypothetical protein